SDARVIGIDVSPGKIVHAREQTADLSNVELVTGDAAEYLGEITNIDLALFTEVDFFDPDGDGLLDLLATKIRPGGVLFASFRSEWFNLVYAVKARDFASANKVRDARSGELFGTAYRFRWYTCDEIRDRLDELGFPVEMRAIGALSGRDGDALDGICRPGILNAADQERLLGLETSVAERYVACGRYILAFGRKEAP